MNPVLEMSIFVTVVNEGSFIRAAEKLQMSKAAVSRHINQLETRLNVLLLQRTTRRLAITEEGRIFYTQAKEILALIDEAEAQLFPHHSEPSGLLRINVPVSFGILHLAPLWKKFMARYPKIELDITLNDRSIDLLSEGYDLAIRIAHLKDSSLISRKLASTRIVVCASPAYLQQHGTPKNLTDLAEHQIITYRQQGAETDWRIRQDDGDIAIFRFKAAIQTNNGDTCRQIALHDGGVIRQPTFLVGDDLARGDLVEILPEYSQEKLGIYAVYPTRKFLPLRVRRLVDFLAQELHNKPW